jgi:hypothetical protein
MRNRTVTLLLPTWADWVAGRDPVLDWILEQ